MKALFKNIGPGTLVAAAFIGPGTVTVCTMAGVNYDFTLLWAMMLSIVATIVLQEMAARLGVITGKGLAQTVREQLSNPLLRCGALVLMLSAILIGNAAYEAGNISGGALGLSAIIPNSVVSIGSLSLNTVVPVIGIIAFILLYFGNYKLLERSLVVLVLLMSISFIAAAVASKPDLLQILKGLFTPKVPEKGWLTVIGLIGTTVVPYNLFLHAALVRQRWKGETALKAARYDTYVSIVLGGLISMAIIIAAAPGGTEVQSVNDLALVLAPVLGDYAAIILGIGLFAAGITSAITAPLAAGFVARECFGWEKNLKDGKFRIVWVVVLLLGVVFSSLGFKPVQVIIFAQAANGLLLPIIAIFLLWIVNRKNLLGAHRNTVLQNVLAGLIILIALAIGGRNLYNVFFT